MRFSWVLMVLLLLSVAACSKDRERDPSESRGESLVMPCVVPTECEEDEEGRSDGEAGWVCERREDGTVTRRLLNTCDAATGLQRQDLERFLDGRPESCSSAWFDQRGLVREETDNKCDGEIDFRTRYIYDAFDRLTRYEEDKDGDGFFEGVEAYVFDDRGNILSWIQDDDVRKPGELRAENRYEYDEGGYLVSFTADAGADGVINTLCTYDPPCPPPAQVTRCTWQRCRLVGDE